MYSFYNVQHTVECCIFFSCSGEDIDGDSSEVPTPVKTPPKSPMRQTSRTRARQRTTSTSSAPQGPVVRSGARTIYTAGRPPWYDSHGQLKEAFVIGKGVVVIWKCNKCGAKIFKRWKWMAIISPLQEYVEAVPREKPRWQGILFKRLMCSGCPCLVWTLFTRYVG